MSTDGHHTGPPLGQDAFWLAIVQECSHIRSEAQALEVENVNLRKSILSLCRVAKRAGLGYQPLLKAHDLDHVLSGPPSDFNKALGNPPSGPFCLYMHLGSHNAAVYTARFSPSGSILASASFDGSVYVWDMNEFDRQELLPAHTSSVLDVSWFNDSCTLVTASLDTCATQWDVSQGVAVSTYYGKGMLLQVKASSQDRSCFYVSDSRGNISVFDRRMPKHTALGVQNDCPVYALSLSQTGNFITSGDRNGVLKVWDARCLRQSPLQTNASMADLVPSESSSWLSEPSSTGQALQHTLCPGPAGQRSPIACVSEIALQTGQTLMAATKGDALYVQSFNAAAAPPFDMTVVHQLRGFTDNNFLVRSAFYARTSAPPAGKAGCAVCLEESLLLATGSADGAVYVFDLMDGQSPDRMLLQKLTGHQDVVYGVAFHPTEPIMVSFSADCTLNVWASTKKAERDPPREPGSSP
eukprot:GGOE01014916.1.p1 GENE.GGOE01014916.1~~GGOE01014916.1.p1  ORF type:complete len:468 (+),score=145.71 GGOE01014916.1:94-1497(+)